MNQNYLLCSGTCVPAAAPIIDRYLQACDAATLTTYGVSGVTGVVSPYAAMGLGGQACLLAWDDVAQAIMSGVTELCIGDWQCPMSSLCDDALRVLSGGVSPPFGVCKPGPRGTLTPAMLSP